MSVPPNTPKEIQKSTDITQPQHVKAKEGWGFGRVFTKFVSGPISRVWSHFTTAEKTEPQEIKRKASHLRDSDVIQTGPGEGMTAGEWKILSASIDKNEQKKLPATITQGELDKLRSENKELKLTIEELKAALEYIDTESDASSTEEDASPRVTQLENLLRDLMQEMPVQTRKPFNYAPALLARLFSKDVILNTVGEIKPWTKRGIVETDGKKTTIFYATDEGKQAVELLDRLGLIKKDASAGGIIYHAQARPTGDQAAKDYITRLLLNWLLEQKNLVIDPEKAKGFLDLSQVESKLSTYLTKSSRADWKPVADELGLPEREELLTSILSLARLTALNHAKTHAEELFDNPADRVQLTKLADSPELKTAYEGIMRRSEEDMKKQTEYYNEQEAQAQKLLERQALIKSILAGGSSVAIAAAPSPPPPPPPPPN